MIGLLAIVWGMTLDVIRNAPYLFTFGTRWDRGAAIRRSRARQIDAA